MGFFDAVRYFCGCTRIRRRRDDIENDESEIENEVSEQKPLHKKVHKKGSIANAVAKFETKTTDTPPPTPSPKKRTRISNKIKTVRCIVCQKRVYAAENPVTHRENTFHGKCFKCSECGCKLSPGEDLKIANGTVHCERCTRLHEQNLKPRVYGKIAGTKTVVDESEQGDIEGLVDTIGVELEEALQGMIPRCAICGGDFMSYKGTISSEGSLKYHSECYRKGAPDISLSSSTENKVSPNLAAKYLPERMVMKVEVNQRILATLFFVWIDKDDAVKSLKSEKRREKKLCINYQLDKEARGNPNFKDAKKRKTSAPIPPVQNGNTGQDQCFHVEVVGGNQISNQPPKLIEPVSIVSTSDGAGSILCARLSYLKYNLEHLVRFDVPCNSAQEELDLTGAKLTITILDDDN